MSDSCSDIKPSWATKENLKYARALLESKNYPQTIEADRAFSDRARGVLEESLEEKQKS